MSTSRLAASIGYAALLAVLCDSTAHAIDAYWRGEVSNVWNEGIVEGKSNWYSDPGGTGGLRNVPDHTATFTDGALTTSLILERSVYIGEIVFGANTPPYSFDVARKLTVTIGITNQSNVTSVMKVRGSMFLEGMAQIAGLDAPAVQITTEPNSTLRFSESSRGGNATVLNSGSLDFDNESSAEEMTITNRAGGRVAFNRSSTGDRAHIVNKATGEFECKSSKRKLGIGSFDNKGSASLNRCTLEVDGNYTQGETGVLNVEIAAARLFGSVVTGQDARVGGALIVNIGPSVVVPDTFKIVTAFGRRTGSFASLRITGRNDVRGRLAYSGKTVALIVEKK